MIKLAKAISMVWAVALCPATAAIAHEWHTTPDKWKEPRIFQTEYDNRYDGRIVLGRNKFAVVGTERTLSANGAYSFMVQAADTTSEGPWNTVISISNERSGLLQVQLLNHWTYNTTVRWVNDKLLYVRVWWGRVLGTDMILDVEKEAIIYREMINGGNIPYMQWKSKDAEPGNGADGGYR